MENLIKIERPNIGKYMPEELVSLIADDDIAELIREANEQEYVFWDRLNKKLAPKNMALEKFWAAIKFKRKYSYNKTLLKNFNEKSFVYMKLPQHEKLQHAIDSDFLGELKAATFSGREKKEIVAAALIREAVASAIIDGAEVGRIRGRKIILEKLAPQNESERLVVNVHKCLSDIEKNFYDKEMNLDLLSHMYSSLRGGVADAAIQPGLLPPHQVRGRNDELRSDDERIINSPLHAGKILYIAPAEKKMRGELAEFYKFANDREEGEFVHPITKAILLYFWVLILNPFKKYNGIIARAVMYWYLARKEYEEFFLLPISENILGSFEEYLRVFTLSLQDDNDATYFIDFIFRQIAAAMESFRNTAHVKKADEEKEIARMQRNLNYNARQIRLLKSLNESQSARTNLSSYMVSFQVTKKTAADDLKKLFADKMLEKKRIGKNVFYYKA